MKRINFFDAFFILYTVILIITALTAAFSPDPSDAEGIIIITAEIEEDTDLSREAEYMIDGRYKTELLSVEEGIITLSARGSLEEAGYLLCGAKYLSICQPIRIVYATGQVDAIVSAICFDDADPFAR
ncbi:MAG: hypothetical protein E7617_06685 [Ruminococcaceae bacterium]|nr:hypothetical protein [Oscillospiraceae bacterium]